MTHIHEFQSVVSWKLYVDGASRGNPGPASVGFVIIANEQIKNRAGYYIGTTTNNYAEYAALIIGLKTLLSDYSAGQIVHILADSQLLVRQITGHYRVKNAHLAPLYQEVKQLLQTMVYTIEHIPRTDNAQADLCANHALDRKIALPSQLEYLYVR